MSLFDKLPDEIFRPLAAKKNHRFFAALLLHLYERTFDSAGDTPRVSELIAEIGDFVDRHTTPETSFEADDADEDGVRGLALREAKGQDVRRYEAYHVLRKTGWLIELRDRYRKLVDLSPEGRLLLRELQRIAVGDSRSYGGLVLNVLGNLEQAIDAADDKSLNIRNAWHFSRDFVQHLRTLSGQMRRVEEAIVKEEEHRNFFRAFFADFVTKYLITDFKSLRTKNNPFRFRTTILERVRHIEGNSLLMARLAEGYVREGRAANAREAEETMRRELSDVHHTFANIDHHLDIIDETQHRIERRVQAVIRYMDRDQGGLIERASQALRALGTCALPLDAYVDTDTPVLRVERPIGDDSLFRRRPPRPDIGRVRLRETPSDPAVVAFEKAKAEYARRVTVTPQRLAAFIERSLEGKSRVLASEVAIDNVDDFIVFQRLREADIAFNGTLARRYRIERLGANAQNEWLEFPDFAICRVGTGEING